MTMTKQPRIKRDIKETSLKVKWTVSRSRDTYGYNICTVEDQNTGKKFRCNGGGYDMLGTSFGDWLQDTYQDLLLLIKDQAYTVWNAKSDGPWDQEHHRDGLYGMNLYNTAQGGQRISLDGACGESSMIRIAEAIGMKIKRTISKGNVTDYIISAL